MHCVKVELDVHYIRSRFYEKRAHRRRQCFRIDPDQKDGSSGSKRSRRRILLSLVLDVLVCRSEEILGRPIASPRGLARKYRRRFVAGVGIMVEMGVLCWPSAPSTSSFYFHARLPLRQGHASRRDKGELNPGNVEETYSILLQIKPRINSQIVLDSKPFTTRVGL